jgi:hypothetical protein
VDKSFLRIIAEYVEQPGGHELAPKLYRMVAEHIRARLDPDESALVAGWFDRLAAGADPQEVFVTKSKGGRKKKGAPDNYDIAWIVHLAIANGVKPAEAYRKVSEHVTVTAHGQTKKMSERTVANIYSRLKAEISELHKNLP